MSLTKAVKKLSASALEEIFDKSKVGPAALDNVVCYAEAAIAKATKERNANAEYQAAKDDCDLLSSGLREVKSYQKAKAAIALALLDEANLSDEDTAALDIARQKIAGEQSSRTKSA